MYITFANQDDDIWWNNLPLPPFSFRFTGISPGGSRDKNHSSSLYGVQSGCLCSSGASRSTGLSRCSALARCNNLTNSAPYCCNGSIYHSPYSERDLSEIPREVHDVKITLTVALYVSCILLPAVVIMTGSTLNFSRSGALWMTYDLFTTAVCDVAVLSSGGCGSFAALIG